MQLIFKRPVAVGMGVGLVLVMATVGVGWFRTQGTLKVALAYRQAVAVAGPLKADFGQDLAAGFTATIEPSVPGTWRQERTPYGVRAVAFKPDKRFEAGRKYTLQIKGVKRAVTGKALGEIKEGFAAQMASGVAKTSPAVPLKLVSNDDKTFVWEPQTPLKQGEKYTFSLEDTRVADPVKRNLFNNIFTTVAQPAIASARSGGYFAPGQTVDITFGQPMEPSATAFKFDLAGKGSWVDDHTYRYVPTEGVLKPGTTYNYVVKAGIKSKVGGVLEADVPYQFASNGAVGASFSPGGGNVGLNAPIKVAFDQPVDHASAQARFSLSPGADGSFSWSGNTMIYSPTLAYQSNYTIKVAPGVVPTWGLPNTAVLSGTLATLPETIKLGVPMYSTQYRMSCELTSLRMLLAFRGVNVGDDKDLLSTIGYNPHPRDQANNVWDNPNLTYVGDLGGYPNTTGYGVHAGPIAREAQSRGRQATASFNVPASYISAQVHGGNPVEFWGHSTPSRADAWNTSSGVVQTWMSSHARVVFGVVGSADNPLGFWIIESMTAKPFYWTTAQLVANMNVVPGVSNQTVVVY